MSTPQIKAIEDYIRLQDRNALTHVIRAATHIGVFDLLEKRQHTLDELSSELSLNRDSLKLLMSVLCETELIQKFGDDFALSTVGKMIPESFRDFGDRHWQYLNGFLRTGTPLPGHNDVPVTDADFQGEWAASEWTQTPAALDLVDALDAGKSRSGLRILEVRCGAAVFGAALAHRDPECQLVLVDDRAGLKRAEKSVTGVGVHGRAQLVEADYTDENLPSIISDEAGRGGFDLVVLAGVAHRHTLEECGQLFKRLAGLVRPDHELAIADLFPGQEKGDRHRLVFELELALRTSKGKVHHPDELRAELEKVGLGEIKYTHLPSPPYLWGLIVATRIA